MYVRRRDVAKLPPRAGVAFRTKLAMAAELVGWAAAWLNYLGKALWVVVVIFLPFVGTLVYLLFRPSSMGDQRMIRDETDSTGAMRYGAPTDPATQLRVLSDLHDAGKLTDAEFDTEKTRILSGR